MTTIALVAFLIGHALIHLGFVSRRPQPTTDGPAWPFDLNESWLVAFGIRPGAVRSAGKMLVLVLLTAYGWAVLAIAGVIAPSTAVPALVAGTAASLVLLVGALHRWLVIGVAIDVALLWAVAIAGWTPEVPV